ncbi:MAG: DUF2505 domain-containing protein [Pseudomonadales bacterium]|uniref:DUF2505 domain-containing protein n=1 Tax=Oleiphilus messinensis TaxID=141451 RepID=A0A1Y0I445_9GAMM|nr:DUF2505 domain-containing protein [Oleiphilus messinensis]ARU54234.1 hypothetical protein OLMES_0126 [Oleiphilus messinensis]MCG8609961.1 DUF2505 domain-containing protein [Pseudomonadales bacterium]
MEINVAHPYPVSADNLFNFLFNEQNIIRKHETLGVKNLRVNQCDWSESEGTIQLTKDVQPRGDMPSVLQKLQPGTTTMKQVENWRKNSDGEFCCDYQVELIGVPANLKGTMVIKPDGEASVIHVSLGIQCKVPLIGKTIAQFIAKDSQIQMESEYEVNQSLILAN